MKEKINKDGFSLNKTKKDLLFCLLLLVIPTVQFAIFYVGVNFNSFLLSFQKVTINSEGEKLVLTDVKYLIENWNILVNDFFASPYIGNYIGNSLMYWGASILIGIPLGLLFSYYISKKYIGHSFFRVILYLPSIISGFILVIFYKWIVQLPLSYAVGYESGLLSPDTKRVFEQVLLILFFNIWAGFGTSVLLYSNAMSAISPEILESASLDGAKGFKEFIHIIFPSIFSTFSVFIVTSIATIFINQASLFSFYGYSASEEISTIGYYIYKRVSESGGSYYGALALLGLILSAIVIPITLIVRKLLDKFGPSEH